LGARISNHFILKTERGNVIKMLAGYYLKVEPELMTSCIGYDHYLGAHPPDRLGSLAMAHAMVLVG